MAAYQCTSWCKSFVPHDGHSCCRNCMPCMARPRIHAPHRWYRICLYLTSTIENLYCDAEDRFYQRNMAIGWVQSPQPSPRPNQQSQQRPHQQQAQNAQALSTSSRAGTSAETIPRDQQQQNAAAHATPRAPHAGEAPSTRERSAEPSDAASAPSRMTPAGSDIAKTPASSSPATGQQNDMPAQPQSNMYGESVISVPPLSTSDDEDEQSERSKATSSHDAAGASSSSAPNNAGPVSSLDFSGLYSMFYRESPKPTQTQSPQGGSETPQQSSQATTANPLLAQRDHTLLRDSAEPKAAAPIRPDTAHESQQRSRFGPSDSASLEEHPALIQASISEPLNSTSVNIT